MIYQTAKGFMRFVNYLLYHIEIVGSENIPETGGCLLCSNHTSMYDPVAIATRIKRPVHFMAKAEIFKNPFLNKFFLSVGTIPVNREKVSVETLKQALKVLKNGEILGIFPEGTRVRDGEQVKPMDGFVIFSLKTKSPIVPIHIQGKFKFRHKIRITFGKPIELTEYYGKKLKPEEISKISQKIMDNIYNLQ